MKKILLSLLCAVFAIGASAQRAGSSSFFSTEKAENPVVFGLRGGMNISTMAGDINVSSKIGFNAGLNVDFSIVESFGVQTGLLFTTKGWKEDDVKANPMYLEIPILASYRYHFTDNLRWEFNFGPYFAYGVGGNYSYDGDSYGDVFGDNGYKRFDAGLALGTGVTISKFYVGLQYEFGLANIVDSDHYSVKNSNFSIGVGYNF